MSINNTECKYSHSKNRMAKIIIKDSIKSLDKKEGKKIKLIWLEAAGCSGNIISLLNAESPDLKYFLENMVKLVYSNSLMRLEGEAAFEQFMDTLSDEYILVVEGAVSTKSNGMYNIIAKYEEKWVTGMEAVKLAGERAKYILAVGTCASFGGISSARPNPSGSLSVKEFIKKEVINIPGCPANPQWVIGTIAYILSFGKPELDDKGRPIMFYGITIHDRCTRRSYFDKGIFAKKLGDEECLFKLGCRGPVTKTDCPIRRWNSSINWPVGDNSPCIGCAQEKFPDGMEPFVKY